MYSNNKWAPPGLRDNGHMYSNSDDPTQWAMNARTLTEQDNVHPTVMTIATAQYTHVQDTVEPSTLQSN